MLVIAVALALRLWHLGTQSLWIDETNNYLQSHGTWQEWLATARQSLVDMPLDRLFLHMVATEPPNEFLFRLPAALFGVLAIPLTYAFASSLWGRRAGLLAAGLLALSPYYIRYTQEARNYSSFLVFHLLGVILLVRALRRPSLGRWIGYAGTAALCLYDHIYAFVTLGLLLGLHIVCAGWASIAPVAKRREWSWTKAFQDSPFRLVLHHMLALLLAGFILLPWVVFLLTGERASENLASWAGALRYHAGAGIDFHLFLDGACWFIANQKTLSPLVVLVLGAAILPAILPPQRMRAVAWLTWAYIGLVILGIAISARLTKEYVAYRRLLFLLPPLFTLAGAGMDALLRWLGQRLPTLRRRIPATWSAVGWPAAILLAIGIAWWPAIQAHYAAQKENWREVTNILRQEATPDDVIINYASNSWGWRALKAYLGPDLAGLRILAPADIVLSDTLVPVAGAAVWQILPFPLDKADADHRTLNDPSRLRVLDGDRSLAPLQMMLSLERRTLRNGSAAELEAIVMDGLERTVYTDLFIHSSWRFNALNTLTTAYERRGRPDLALELYRTMTTHPAISQDVRDNLASIVRYLERRLSDNKDMIVGGYWADSRLRAALIDQLVKSGLVPSPKVTEEALAQLTRTLALSLDDEPASWNQVRQSDFDDPLWSDVWEARFLNAEVRLVSEGCRAGQSPCLLIETHGSDYHGALRQSIPLEEGTVYLLTCSLRTESRLGLQGKVLYVEYQDAGKTRGTYASAFWGSSDWHTFVALFVPPAGVKRMGLSPVLIDHEGRVWVDQVHVVPIMRQPA